MPLWVTIETERGSVTIAFEQAMAIKRISDKHEGHIHWHMNDCECGQCLTVHAPDCAYVISADGGETRFEGRGCQCDHD